MLESKRVHFDEATEAICNDASEIDNEIILLTDMIYDICFSVCGKTVRVKGYQAKRRKPATWFNQDCKDGKRAFLNAKRTLKNSYTENNKIAFLEARSSYLEIKRKARLKYQNEENVRLADMSKNAPKSFWKNINNFRNKKSSATGGLTIGEFQEYFNRIMNNRDRGENLDFSNIPDIIIEVQELDKPITEADAR